jgi:hypothetical protein
VPCGDDSRTPNRRRDAVQIEIVNTNASRYAVPDSELWTVRRLAARHKLAALGVAAVVVLVLVMILTVIFGPKAGAVTDATTCTQWGSANQNQQAAYARLYVREHGPVRGGRTSPASIIASINDGCMQAYGVDASDTTTVVQAIAGKF